MYQVPTYSCTVSTCLRYAVLRHRYAVKNRAWLDLQALWCASYDTDPRELESGAPLSQERLLLFLAVGSGRLIQSFCNVVECGGMRQRDGLCEVRMVGRELSPPRLSFDGGAADPAGGRTAGRRPEA